MPSLEELDIIEGYQPDRSLDTIRTLGRLLDDLERVRIMNSNRIGALERIYGEPLPHLLEIHAPLTQAEHLATLELVRVWRRYPLASWAREIKGLGEKSIARLIAEIGDPSVGSIGHWETASTNGAMPEATTQTDDAPDDGDEESIPETDTHTAHDSEKKSRIWVVDAFYNRTVSQLWAYCGVGDPARSRIPRDAAQAELLARGKPRAKKQLYLISTGLLKSGILHKQPVTEWGVRYAQLRDKYAERIHAAACAPCHAQAGDPWKPGHQHMASLRKLEKDLLKEMWREARRLRGLGYE